MTTNESEVAMLVEYLERRARMAALKESLARAVSDSRRREQPPPRPALRLIWSDGRRVKEA